MRASHTLDALAMQEKIVAIIAAELRVDPQRIGPTTHLKDDLAADSLDALTIALQLERAFDIKISDEAVQAFVTPADIAAGIAAALAAGLDESVEAGGA